MHALQPSRLCLTAHAYQLKFTARICSHLSHRQTAHGQVLPCQQSLVTAAALHSSTKELRQVPRFYAPQLPPAAGISIELDPEEARHAVRVLRLKPGDCLELCDGRGQVVLCELTATSKSSAQVMATADPEHEPWSGPQWVVAAACLTLKGGRTDWLVEKATELGAHTLLPLVTARSPTGTTRDKFKTRAVTAGSSSSKKQRKAAAHGVIPGVDWPETSSSSSSQDGALMSGGGSAWDTAAAAAGDFQASRLDRLAVAATKQCLRTHALQVLPPVHLDQLLPELQTAAVSIAAMAGGPPVLQVLQQQWQQAQQEQQEQQQQGQGVEGSQQHDVVQPPGGQGRGHQQRSQLQRPWEGRPCYLLVGPEGDFTPEEVLQLSEAGVLPVGLGPSRLRTETAAIAALSAAVLFSDAV